MPRTLLAGLVVIALVACSGGAGDKPAAGTGTTKSAAAQPTPASSSGTQRKPAAAPVKPKAAAPADTTRLHPLTNHN
jgi:hypothetical protein